MYGRQRRIQRREVGDGPRDPDSPAKLGFLMVGSCYKFCCVEIIFFKFSLDAMLNLSSDGPCHPQKRQTILCCMCNAKICMQTQAKSFFFPASFRSFKCMPLNKENWKRCNSMQVQLDCWQSSSSTARNACLAARSEGSQSLSQMHDMLNNSRRQRQFYKAETNANRLIRLTDPINCLHSFD